MGNSDGDQPFRLELLLGKYEPVLKAAFCDANADIRSQATLRLLVECLELGDVAGTGCAARSSALPSGRWNWHLPRSTTIERIL